MLLFVILSLPDCHTGVSKPTGIGLTPRTTLPEFRPFFIIPEVERRLCTGAEQLIPPTNCNSYTTVTVISPLGKLAVSGFKRIGSCF